MHRAAAKSCPLDSMSTSVVLQVLDVLLPVITSLINLSFEKGHFAKGWSEALISPLLKRCGLDIVYKNFRCHSVLCSPELSVPPITGH